MMPEAFARSDDFADVERVSIKFKIHMEMQTSVVGGRSFGVHGPRQPTSRALWLKCTTCHQHAPFHQAQMLQEIKILAKEKQQPACATDRGPRKSCCRMSLTSPIPNI